jgi:hypothetical protein
MVATHSPAEVDNIKALLISGLSRAEVGRQLGMTRSVVCGVVHRMKLGGVVVPRSPPRPKQPKLTHHNKPIADPWAGVKAGHP